jgi:HD-GYP domain-containing protein (c-di-GMP phosphodiesterase class II)
VNAPGGGERLRLAEVLAALSLVTDLARGHAPEEAVRACVVATRLAELSGLDGAARADVYYTTLLRYVGCTATSHEYAAALGGDDVAVRRRGDMIDPANPREAMALLLSLGAGRSRAGRARTVASAATRARAVTREGSRADCEVAARLARRFELEPAVEESLLQIFERWDGRGGPRGLAGEDISAPARFAAVAFAAVMFSAAAGADAAFEVIRRWSGRALDPAVAEAFLAEGPALLGAAAGADAWEEALDREPEPRRTVSDRGLDEVALGFADAVDLKSVFLGGHSRGVAVLAETGGRALGLDEAEATTLRRASLLHDLGRAGVATGIWEKPGPLSIAEWEQVRLHAYHSERILTRSRALVPLARIAGMHHVRPDGRGYHRGAAASAIGRPARVLAAADAYHAMTEERPHRPALAPEAAARELEAMAAGRALDPEAVRAVLEAAGQAAGRSRPAWPAGLTDREVEVLRLLARSLPERQIARRLFISPSTVHTHVLHVYEKAGVATRAGAALFAMEHGLLED